MGINAYAKKIDENDEYVEYSYGSYLDNQTGRLRYLKSSNELVPVKNENDAKHSREMFKVAIKIEKAFEMNGVYPDKVSSQS